MRILFSKMSGNHDAGRINKFRTTYIFSSTHKELDSSLKTFATDEPLTLTPGGFYFVRVAALNGAGLTAVHDTDGVIVDPSPPVVSKIGQILTSK